MSNQSRICSQMNQAAGLKLSAGTYRKGPYHANLEDIAARDIIVVKEIALQNDWSQIPFFESKSSTLHRYYEYEIMLLISDGFL